VRFRLSDFENASVAKAVPHNGLCGTVVRRLALTDWGDNWLLLQLDSPFEYHGQTQQQVLIRSRLLHYELGRDPQTSVFMLLLPNATALDKPTHSSQDFEHVSWATANALPVS
jgi:hypothetical protein